MCSIKTMQHQGHHACPDQNWIQQARHKTHTRLEQFKSIIVMKDLGGVCRSRDLFLSKLASFSPLLLFGGVALSNLATHFEPTISNFSQPDHRALHLVFNRRMQASISAVFSFMNCLNDFTGTVSLTGMSYSAAFAPNFGLHG